MNTQTLTQILNELDVFGTEAKEYDSFAEIAIELNKTNTNLLECVVQAFEEHAGFPLSTKKKQLINENIQRISD